MLSDVIYEYENILLGKKKTFSSTYFELSEDQNEQTALAVFRHAITRYLRWTPTQVRECFDWTVICRMKLNTLIKHIQFPRESDEEKDLYILHDKLYPQRFKPILKDATISVYERVLSGERSKFPKGYFEGTDGLYRSLICFQHMITLMPPFDAPESMYKYFASSKGTSALKKYRLTIVCNSIYETPIDYLHAALPREYKDEYLYRMYKFNLMYKRYQSEKKALSKSSKKKESPK